MQNKLTPRRIALLSALLAVSLVLSVVETMLGTLIPLPIPGVKLGLANIISMFLLSYFSLPAALTVGILRSFAASLFTGGFGMFLYSAPGVLLSILAMFAALKTLKALSIVGISMIGACIHNVAQVGVAVLTTGETQLFYYAFILLIVGAVSGTITGAVARTAFPKAASALKLHTSK